MTFIERILGFGCDKLQLGVDNHQSSRSHTHLTLLKGIQSVSRLRNIGKKPLLRLPIRPLISPLRVSAVIELRLLSLLSLRPSDSARLICLHILNLQIQTDIAAL